ncbi:hypothetical protein CXG81DRAFT_14205 [Caulochytrium protostelioides]|uniref:Uncharacterized protein n=1 Tax=Caulochytrium protostelioides TaxID=1555241 RepID=A0A4P9X3S0_9FUNG|nr:hypothetical protein CXG81DRAFT_14205 [Caulochytrium protostelioides]|eukprot:RKO99670.1 hypothetical protein CXG81DRAFT_14205 [Caulochytrium protostelioides]
MVADHVLWTEFQDHVRQSVAAADADITTPFLKRVLAEDIEPVLFYAYPYPGVTGPLAKLAGMPIATKRKLLEWTIRGELEFSLWCLGDHHGAVSHADQNAMLATTLSHALLSGFARARHLTRTAPRDPAAAAAHTHAAAAVEPVPRAKCWTCTVLRECEFRVRNRTPPGEWRPLCRFCRDRLLAVQDFFAFMGQIRPGGMRLGRADRQSGTVMGLFRHMLWLRRRMCLARIGSCNLFEADPPLGVQVGGAEWEKWVQISS